MTEMLEPREALCLKFLHFAGGDIETMQESDPLAAAGALLCPYKQQVLFRIPHQSVTPC